MDGLMIGLRQLDILVFASAANDDRDVDAIKCVDLLLDTICYESHVWIPCEVSRVICVGGVGWNSDRRIQGSNYGSDVFATDSVDIYGPYVQYTTPDPDDGVRLKRCGTSCASPFVAGVAALIKAAKPSLDAGELEDTLFAWSTQSPDPLVRRLVNAYDPVVAMLGNAPPDLDIELDTGTYSGGIPFPLSAHLADAEDLPFSGGWTGLPTIEWHSSIDGIIGNAPLTAPVLLSYGLHTITATATDSAGITITDTRQWYIANHAPVVDLQAPATGGTFFEGQTVLLRGSSTDQNRVSGMLEDDEVQWFTAPLGNSAIRTLVATGHKERAAFVEGTWLLIFKGTDEGGASDEEVIVINVGPPPLDFPPTPEITSAEYVCAGPNPGFTLIGEADDPEDGALTGASLVWTKTVGGNTTFVGTGTNVYMPFTGIPTGQDFTITLTATDSENNSAADFVVRNWACIV
jgi:hypothetical protein